MKKILALLLVAVMIVSFCAACAKNTTPSTTTETTESNNTETTPAESTDTEEVPDAAAALAGAQDIIAETINDAHFAREQGKSVNWLHK